MWTYFENILDGGWSILATYQDMKNTTFYSWLSRARWIAREDQGGDDILGSTTYASGLDCLLLTFLEAR